MVFLFLYASLLVVSFAYDIPTQPLRKGPDGQFELIGNSLISAQQMFLGTADRVYIVDKVENNPSRVKGHPAWAEEYALTSNTHRAMDAITNTFCAGGNVLGNGTWLNVGGNQAVTYGGVQAETQIGGGPYNDPDGRNSVRMLKPCDDDNCDWTLSFFQADQRWYPTLETLEDGTMIIIGGCRWGGYVNDAQQNNPTYEFFPTRGKPIISPHLTRTLPTNLYPLTWLLPSGRLLLQSNWETILLDYKTGTETLLDTMPDAVRTYPASAGTVMLPLTPANNWTATILFCGGSNVSTSQWTDPAFVVVGQQASQSCVKITPDMSPSYEHDDSLPEGRSMANFILLPDGTIFCINGAHTGTAGYGYNPWAVGMSYADNPHFTPLVYNPSAAQGTRWSSQNFSSTKIPRMYHSSALLLPDGAVMIAGSNPNADYSVADLKYPTEYRMEFFYPGYYTHRRPEPRGIPSRLSYGGPPFTVALSLDDLGGDVTNIVKTKAILIRPGFSTHSMNMGQRYVELENTYSSTEDNDTGFLHVSQVPPNPSIIAPGPALFFVVVNGIPSIGVQVMIGSGELGTQKVFPVDPLPASSLNIPKRNENATSNGQGKLNGASRSLRGPPADTWKIVFVSMLVGSFLLTYFGL